MIETRRLKALKECSFLTGSVRWECDNPQDEDYIILRSDWMNIVGNDLGDFYHTDGSGKDDFSNFFLDYNGTKYNFIIPWKNEELFLWMRASYMMDEIPVKYIQNKGARVHLFETFKGIIRGEWDKPMTLTETLDQYIDTGDDVPF